METMCERRFPALELGPQPISLFEGWKKKIAILKGVLHQRILHYDCLSDMMVQYVSVQC